MGSFIMNANFLIYLYVPLVTLISLFGLHALVLSGLFLFHVRSLHAARRADECEAEKTGEWPPVTVQLPLYNEKYVAERIIDAVCAFDYPRDRLHIQVLDDSTDETTRFVVEKVNSYQALGYHITMLHRANRQGYKAGALAEALAKTDTPYVAVFDADFLPPPDFLKRVIPCFLANPRLGMVQSRWGHLNNDYNILTRAQSLFLDGHVIVEQVARSRSGLLINFNGSGGVWRTECIRDSGNWQWDTLSEDIDLSYRAQLRGWQMRFLPDVVVPAEIPPTVTAFKRQQYRWAFGTIQVFKKLMPKVWTARNLTLPQRIAATFHLGTNLMHLAGLLVFLISLPIALLRPDLPSSMGWISFASAGPSVMFAIAQLAGYRNGLRRLMALPVLMMLGVGLAVSNAEAVILALLGRQGEFKRTPKYRLENKKDRSAWKQMGYAIETDRAVWLEIFMAVYMAIGLGVAIERAPAMIPVMVLGMLSFGYISALSLVETHRPNRKARRASEQVETIS
mgnify:CR=1 FL=1